MKILFLPLSAVLIAFIVLMRWLFGFWISTLNIPLVFALLFFVIGVTKNRKSLSKWFMFKKDGQFWLGPALLLSVFVFLLVPNFYFSYYPMENSKDSKPTEQTPLLSHSIYFVQGHGERSVRDSSEVGLSKLLRELKKDRYDVLEIYLDNLPAIPEEASLLVFPGLRKGLTEAEFKLINEYILKGGKVLFSFDPEHVKQPIVFKNYGVTMSNQIQIDKQSKYGDTFYSKANTENIKSLKDYGKNKSYVLFPGVGTIFTQNNKNHIHTGVVFDENSDKIFILKSKLNPIKNSFIKSVSAIKHENAYFIADTDFILNHYLNVSFNREVIKYIINDLVFETKVPMDKLNHSTDRLHLNEAQRTSFLTYLLAIPFGLMLTGFLFWANKINRKNYYE
jgi:hypothetical protein